MNEAKTCNNCVYSYTYSEYSARNGNLTMNVEGVLKQANPDKGNFVTNFFGSAPTFFCIRLQKQKLSGDFVDMPIKATDSCNYFKPITTADNAGFKKGKRECFLTTACVEYMKKADDCEELTTLRNFRDTYVKNLIDGEALIEEYYKVAPNIVAKINASDKKDEYYQNIYSTIQICLHHIAEDKKEQALQEYRAMVLRLQNI
ncbi:MAG: hypothetical protein E7364_06090 [Clostridiales bacterium]|nr:hypothetical protein [Clostridiales bacterium]